MTPGPTIILALLASTAVAAVVAAPAGLSPQQQTAAARTFAPRDVFSLARGSDAQISPDGKRLAYTRVSEDILTDVPRREIWLIDVASGSQTLLAGAGSSQPRWSPDGTRLAYVGAAAGRPQIFIRWLASGQSGAITALADGPSDITWAPDGRTIAFTMLVPEESSKIDIPVAKPEGAKWAEPLKVIDQFNYRSDDEGYARPGHRHVFVVAADGGGARQLTFGNYEDGGGIEWMRDGQQVLFVGNRNADWERDPLNSEIYSVDVADGAIKPLTTRNGPDGQPQVSPDGRWIAYVGFDDKAQSHQDSQLSVMRSDGSGAHVITGGLDRSVESPRWAADGKSIYVNYDEKGESKIARVSLDGRVTEVAGGLAGFDDARPYVGGTGFSVAKDGTVAFLSGDVSHPAEVAVSGHGAPRRLTRLNDQALAGKSLGSVKPLAVKSSAGDLPIDAWMVMPPNVEPGRKYPMILEIHGGPYGAYGPIWSSEYQLYASAGYVVLYCNPRGSTSYGEAFSAEIDHNYPSHDYDDLMSAVDAAIATGSVDPERLFVTGGSGGGLLTTWIVGKTSRFKAAVAQKPVINWTSEVLTVDMYAFMARYWFGKMPWEDPEQYWRRSPLSLVGNINTPTAVMVGELDYRTPPGEDEQLYEALRLRSVPTELIRVPGASHGDFSVRPSQMLGEVQAILAWFGRYDPTRK